MCSFKFKQPLISMVAYLCVVSTIFLLFLSYKLNFDFGMMRNISSGHLIATRRLLSTSPMENVTRPPLDWHLLYWQENVNVTWSQLDWQEITEIGGSDNVNKKTKFFVYSAYLDSYKNSTVLRVIGITPSFSKKEIYCHIFDETRRRMGVFPATINTTRCPQHSLPYSAAFILCKLDLMQSTTQQQGMKFVSVSPSATWSYDIDLNSSNVKLSNLVNITIANQAVDAEPHKFAVCVQPMFHYDNVFQFVQWMEFLKMMGVSHFTFYNMSIGPRVSCVMKSKAVNDVTPIHVHQWTVPIANYSLLHVNGQIAQGNDCAFRYRGVSKYVVFVDVDEMIIPNYTYAHNYEELIHVIDEKWKVYDNVAQYQFRGAFYGFDFGQFSTAVPKNNSDNIELEDLFIYKYVERELEFYPHKIRSKFITIPRRIRIIEPGVHSIDEGVDNAVEIEIPTNIASLHHYRPFGCWNNCSVVPKMVDYSGHFFVLQLLDKVRSMMHMLEDECGHINIRT